MYRMSSAYGIVILSNLYYSFVDKFVSTVLSYIYAMKRRRLCGAALRFQMIDLCAAAAIKEDYHAYKT